jgi:uncharacterized protein (DUF342 family)
VILKYIADQYIFYIVINKKNIVNQEKLNYIVKKVKNKFDRLLILNKISNYKLFKIDLNKISDNLIENKDLIIDIGIGYPKLKGINLKLVNKTKYQISIDNDRDIVKNWKISWIIQNISDLIEKYYNIKNLYFNKIYDFQIYSFWLNFLKDQKYKIDINLNDDIIHNTNKNYNIIIKKIKKEIILLLNNKYALYKIDQIINHLNEIVDMVYNEFGFKIFILKEEIINMFKKIELKKSNLGFNYPISILAGLDISLNEVYQETCNQNRILSSGILNFNISSDNTIAKICNFDMKIYDDKKLILDHKQIKNEIYKIGIKYGIEKKYILDILEAIKNKKNINNFTVSTAKLPISGKKPVLEKVYELYNQKSDFMLDNRNLIFKDQIIAKINFKEPPVFGIDIFGNKIIPKNNEKLDIILGDYVLEKKEGVYYSTASGIPVIDKLKIYVKKFLIHDGNLNINSKIINTYCPVNVKGDISKGAKLNTDSHLFVNGSLFSSKIKVNGDLKVKQAVITGDEIVYIGGDLYADFIENSKIVCKGNLYVNKAVINSQIIVGGQMHIDGIMAGGFFSAFKEIKVQNLGFPNGAITEVKLGSDFKNELGIKIRENRILKFEKFINENQKIVKEINKRNYLQLTKRHIKLKQNIEYKLSKKDKIYKKLKQHIYNLKKKLNYNYNAKITIENKLTSNCNIYIGDKKAKLITDGTGLMFFMRKNKKIASVPI